MAFHPAGVPCEDITESAAIDASAIAISKELIDLACGHDPTPWRAARHERQPKLYDAASFVASRNWNGDGVADELVPRLLVRQVASTFGRLERCADDSWLPAKTLARISASVQTIGFENLSLTSLAAAAGLSVSAFARGFRGSTGMTPGEFLIAIRLERAEMLLSSTALTVAEIARSVGLSSGAHLTEQFRSRRGITPGRFRVDSRRTGTDAWIPVPRRCQTLKDRT